MRIIPIFEVHWTHHLGCRQIMAPKQNTVNSSDINQLRHDREALIAQKSETYKKAVAMDSDVKKAIERCPKKENASSAKLQERINQMEEEIEISSLNANQEKEVFIELIG